MILLETNWNLLLPVIFLGLIVVFLIFRIYKMRHIIGGGGGAETSEHTIELNDKDFQKTISKGLTLVDFWAPWCAPCRMQGPIVNELANEMHEHAQICKMDVDQNQGTARKYGIKSIPTIMVFKDGQMVKQFVGVKAKVELKKELEKHL
jgi:thioredoxin 1